MLIDPGKDCGMSDWTEGYVTDVTYTQGYYGLLNPHRIRLAFAMAGLAAPEVGTACELGFGHGLSTNVHAAGSVVSWHGNDFNPSQAAFAQELARASGSSAALSDESFQEFCARPDLPEFDFIALHGVWSWISEANRAVIVDFIRRRLKVGGVLYISYNTLPGWSGFAPLRHLMFQHSEVLGVRGAGVVERLNAALGFTEQLLATNQAFLRAHPLARERLEAAQGASRNYLAHEYLNAEWHPMYFADVARLLQTAKLGFACPAHLLDSVVGLNLTDEQRQFLAAIPDPLFRESVRDVIMNQAFRRDYWVKGARVLSPLERIEALRRLRLVLVTRREDVALTGKTPIGEVGLNAELYGPVLEALGDHRPRSFAQLEQAVAPRGVALAALIEVVLVLARMGHLHPVGEDAEIARARRATERLNAHLIAKARSSGDLGILASPVTGGGVGVGRFQQLFLEALLQGQKKPADWAAQAWRLLAAQEQTIIKDGRSLATPEENLAELNVLARAFAEQQLPVLRALQVA
jgi:SAM-dependent methyltransferase